MPANGQLPEQLGRALEGFSLHLEADGKAVRTVESYSGDVGNFLLHIAGTGKQSLIEIARADVTCFIAGLSRLGFRPATVNKTVNSLSCFEQYLKEAYLLPETVRLVEPKRDRAKLAEGSEAEVNVLVQSEVEALLALISNPQKSTQKERLTIHLLLYTGVRVSELVGIKLVDLDLAAGLLNIRGKCGKLREVPLRREIVELITEYLKGERSNGRFKDSKYLLVNQRAPVMHRDTVNSLLERIGGKLGIRLHPHLFRHTFCSRLVEKGVPLTTVVNGHLKTSNFGQ